LRSLIVRAETGESGPAFFFRGDMQLTICFVCAIVTVVLASFRS
jgi:hypothetical protein